MAYITLKRKSLQHNYSYLENFFKENDISWGVVTKILCGNKKFINEVIQLGIKEAHDSRISNLKVAKEIDPNVQTVYIKPPAKKAIPKVVKYADVSFNTELSTIRLISEEAKKQGKVHKIIIMIEMGDLREGVMGEQLLDFYGKVFELPNIQVVGIGTNLNCLHGVMPSQDKLIQLSLYEQLIEAKFDKKIPWVSGGTSVVIPLLMSRQLPKGVNHFRVGETLYFGTDLVAEAPIKKMKQDVFTLNAQIIELIKKPKVPVGELATNPSGEKYEIDEDDYGKESYRAILDLGLLDISTDYMIPVDEELQISGASSDMLVIDLGNSKRNFKVGDWIKFKLKYMGALSLLNSSYIDKVVE
ncbi:MAG: alanine/ornithine racemase family PLP-dependent enzyme [Cyclobacteriaceae bacterium]|nr:alanine/ornithine racemase family PLP-dependent enzyme [Cyclobacteriaceae bacterium SS2]